MCGKCDSTMRCKCFCVWYYVAPNEQPQCPHCDHRRLKKTAAR